MAVHTGAALAGHFHQSGGGAGGRGHRNISGAKRRAADGSIDTDALVFTTGTEALPVLIHPAVIFTRASFMFGCERKENLYLKR